ncbi:MAG: hypothetical protein ACO1OQ_08335, partial [Rufibacter sp.]
HRQEADLAGAAGEPPVQPAAQHQGGAQALLVPQAAFPLILPFTLREEELSSLRFGAVFLKTGPKQKHKKKPLHKERLSQRERQYLLISTFSNLQIK